MPGDADIFLRINDWSERLAEELPALENVIRLHAGKGKLQILDLGCGTGQHLQVLAKNHPEHAFFGLDKDADRVKRARASATREGLAITFVEGDFPVWLGQHAGELGKYDIIYAIGNSIALIWDTGGVDATIAAISSMLAPGGYLYFQIQNNEHPKRGYAASRVVQLDNDVEAFTVKHYMPDTTHRAMIVEFLTFRRGPGDLKYGIEAESYGWPLVPLADIKASLARHGFARVEAWSDHARGPFDPATSNDLVVLAKKGLGESILCDGKGMRVPRKN
nr:methyltransferase domain-containing protein [Candidatus Sigynarchaeota archaeon]